MHKLRVSFGFKLFAAMAGIVLAVTLSIYTIVTRVFEHNMRETAHYQLEEQMDQTVRNAEFYLDQLRSIYLNITADSMLVQDFADGYNTGLNPRLQYPIRKMDTLSAVYQWVYSIYMYDVETATFFNSNSLSISELVDDTWLRQAMKDNGMYHFSLLKDGNINPFASCEALSVGGPIRRNFTGEPVAYFSILVSLETLQNRIFPPSFSEGTLYAIYDNTGTHLMGDLADWRPDSLLPSESEVMYNGNRYLQYISTSPEYDWSFLILTPSKALYSGIHVIRSMTVPLVLSALIVALILSSALSWRFTRPITTLTRAVRNYRSKDNEVDTIEDHSYHDEFQELNEGLIDMAGRINHLIVDVYQQELKKREMELKMLHRSIDPHFVYNVLDSINWQVTLGKNKEASLALLALSRYLRSTMFRQGEWTDLKKAREEIEAYNRLQSIFYTEKIICHIHFPEALMSLYIPSMLLQPIIENCYTHGYPEGYVGNPFISVSARREKDALVITVVDNGTGIPAENLSMLQNMLQGIQEEGAWGRETKYFALRNVQSRIQIQCGRQWGLHVDSSSKGTTVSISLPIMTGSEVETAREASCTTS